MQKKKIAKATEKSLIILANAFSAMGCIGRIYEPKMPSKLKK